ncbi:thioredoxin-like domain protein [Leptospira ryugenii]|uniref:Thioredoxin-like domain protein n=1 Tax=Leptospira ryugenii TaxID=1917863 RepID=A0A2P2E0W4_9LEPT|nr:thioredoxin-like domain protein [Leptospira ryugenii]
MVFFLFFLPTIAIHSETIWESSIAKALERSKQEEKPILIDLYADWCTYCKVLEKEIFPDKEVSETLRSFITVRIDGEAFPNLKKRYRVEGYPTILFIDSDTNLLGKITGLATKSMILKYAKQVLLDPSAESLVQKEIKKYPEKANLYFRLGTVQYQKKNFSQALKSFQTAIDLNKSKEDVLVQDSEFNIALIHFESNSWKEAKACWYDFIKRYPKSPNRLDAQIYLGLTLNELGDKKAAKDLLQQIKSDIEDPTDKETVEQILKEIQ